MSGRLFWISLVAMLALPLATAQSAPGEGFEYRLEIACPGAGTFCPVTAVDGADAMGDPSVAVDPFRPTNLIIASLHGGGDSPGAPGPKSRTGLAFTTFTSTNGGASWNDNPFSPPTAIRSNGRAFGETPALTVSPYGQAFVGSLYSVPRGSDTASGFDYVLAAQKFRTLQSINENQGGSGDYNAQFLGSMYPGNAIRQMWYVFNPHTDNMTVVWTEQQTPHSRPASETLARYDDTLDGMAARLRAEAARHDVVGPLAALQRMQSENTTAPRSAIGVAWTDLNPSTKLSVQPRDVAIAPCETSTNPVIKEGMLYIGCKVGAGAFRWNPAAKAGDIEIFRMHPDGGEPEYLGPAPVTGGAPKMGVRSDGRVALVSAGVVDGQFMLDAVYGALDPETGMIAWGKIHHHGDEVRKIEDWDPVDANIQDLTYREYSGVLHIILKRVLERSPDADRPASPFAPTVHKSIIAVDERHGYLYYHDLDIGSITNRTQDATLMQQSDAVFNDITDDLLELAPQPHRHGGQSLGDNYQRQFFAVGDYGVIQFAEIVEVTDLRGPGIAVVSLPPPPAPAPAPVAVSSTALAGALSGAVATSVTAVQLKKKAAVRAKKKR